MNDDPTIPTQHPDDKQLPRPKTEAAYRVRLSIEWNHPVDDAADDGLGAAKHEIDRITAELAAHIGLRVQLTRKLARVRGLGPQPKHRAGLDLSGPADSDFDEDESSVGGRTV